MPKGKKAKSKIMIAAEAARKAHENAVAQDAKASNATTKAAITHAKEKLDAAEGEERRERFENVAGSRVIKVISTIDALKRVTNRKHYSFTQADLDAVTSAITESLAVLTDHYKTALTATSKASTAGKFKFPEA